MAKKERDICVDVVVDDEHEQWRMDGGGEKESVDNPRHSRMFYMHQRKKIRRPSYAAPFLFGYISVGTHSC